MTDDTSSVAAHPSARRPPGYAPTSSTVFGRDVSYFDAVYGFAATLLIANVDAPPPEAWQNFDALVASGVTFQALGFVLSFTVIAVFWRVNVRMTKQFSGLDSPTTILNLVAAGSVIFLAFTTQGISDPRSADLRLPTILYAVNVALVSICLIAMYQVARARGLLKHPTSRRQNAAELAGALVTPIVFLASIPVTIVWGAGPGKWSWATLIVLSPLVGLLAVRYAATGTPVTNRSE